MLYGNEDSIFRIELGYRYNYFNKDLKYQWQKQYKNVFLCRV